MPLTEARQLRIARDLRDITDLLEVIGVTVGTATPGSRSTSRPVPGPKPPVSLEKLTLADGRASTPTDRPDAHDDTPARILGWWWIEMRDWLPNVAYPTDLADAPDTQRVSPVALARLVARNAPAYTASAPGLAPEMLAWDMRVLAHRLRTATGETNPDPPQCPACGHAKLHADSETGRVVTCQACGWQRTAPDLRTLPEIADHYTKHASEDTWTPTLRRLRYWADHGRIQPHTGLLSPTGEQLYRLEAIDALVRAKNGC
ncbi:MAG: hypothetical protein LBV30_05065 [Propionibacteriaceae bacterium]|nr:hypothetical protein [Propionibacteriaceae bacterium]